MSSYWSVSVCTGRGSSLCLVARRPLPSPARTGTWSTASCPRCHASDPAYRTAGSKCVLFGLQMQRKLSKLSKKCNPDAVCIQD
eukprot:3935457-Rhodomonas_salina.1